MNDILSHGQTLILKNKNEVIMQKRALAYSSTSEHSHKFVEIAYIDSGFGAHYVGDGSVTPLEKGDLILLTPNISHRYHVSSQSPLVVYNCIFTPKLLHESIKKDDDFINIVYKFLFSSDSLCDSENKGYILLHKAFGISNIIKEMYTEHTQKTDGYIRMNKANLIRLLIAIFRLKKESIDKFNPQAYQKAVVECAVEYMKEYYPEPISCEALASRSYLSVGYFHRIFKNVTGYTPIHFLQNIRIENAARLLRTTSMSIQKIAVTVGYSDMKYFYKLFEKKYNITPKQYRESV